jgi:hypothetical protein
VGTPFGGKQGSMFFFEKKNQKTFVHLHACQLISEGTKVFLLLFLQKKKALAY